MSTESPFKSLLKKIILWSVIIGGVLALFVPIAARSGVVESLTSAVAGKVLVQAATESPCQTFGGCVGGEDVGADLADDTGQGLAEIIFRVVNVFILIAGAVAVGFVVFAGYQIIFSNGDQSRQKAGKDTLRNAIVGLVIIILAAGIVQLVAQVIGGLSF